LLDYDGTLAPIAPHPDLAHLPVETKNVLQRLSNLSDVYIAVISGRGVENVKNMVGIEGITYAGNHGLEILHPDGSKFVHPMPVEYEEKVSGLLKALQDSVSRRTFFLCHKLIINLINIFNRFVATVHGLKIKAHFSHSIIVRLQMIFVHQ
jgi:trehalose-phosphatase